MDRQSLTTASPPSAHHATSWAGRSASWWPATRIALIFLAVSIAYISISDRLVDAFVPLPYVSMTQTVKGLLFVGLTAVLIACLVRREIQRTLVAQDWHRLLFEQSPFGIMYSVHRGPILDCNPAGLTMLGYRPEDLSQMTREQVMDPSDPRLVPALQSRDRSGEYVGELRMRRADGQVFEAAVASRVFALSDGSQRTCFLFQDISFYKAMEAQLRQGERLQAVGEMASEVIHDVRNLLTVIVSAAENLTDVAAESGGASADADLILETTDRAEGIFRRLLDFVRAAPPTVTVCSLNRSLVSMSTLLERLLGRSFGLTLELTPGLPPLRVDLAQLENALVNLVVNARDAMTDGGRVIISTAWIDAAQARRLGLAAQEYLAVSVADTGCGMSPEVLARATEKLFTTKALGKGSGLGLSTVRSFVEQSGGSMRIDSALGEGTRVTLHLPVSGPPQTTLEASTP